MVRVAPWFLTIATLLPMGCRSIGRFPGIDPGEYAYSYFNGTTSQVYEQPVPEVETSTLEALADLGFTKIDPRRDASGLTILAKTIDHRHARVRIARRNAMTELSVRIGLEGDELVSQALIQRVALNFGTLPRTFIPLEPALARRSGARPTVSAAGPPPTLLAEPPDSGLFAPANSP